LFRLRFLASATVGGDRLERSLAVLRPGGRLVSVATEPPREEAAERGIEAVYFVEQQRPEEQRPVKRASADSKCQRQDS